MSKTATVTFMRWRYYVVACALLLLFIVLIAHVTRMQVIPSAPTDKNGFVFLQDEGAARTLRTESIMAYRGVVTDRNGEPLAVSTPVQTIWMNPKVVRESQRDLGALAEALDMPIAELRKKVQSRKGFLYLHRHMIPERAEKILALDIPGVNSQAEFKRYYPAGEVAAHLVGITNVDDQGQEGIELAYDDWLSGVSGARQVEKDLKGRILRETQLLRAPKPGKNIRLSIDLRMQYLAYRELKAAVAQHRAASGSVVVLDTKTGEVLAMANQPSYNPNDRSSMRVAALRNRAMTDLFEPGSTMKPITVLSALESGQYVPSTEIDTSPGHIRVGNKTLLDPVNYGVMDITKIITKSSQVGITKIALDLEPEIIRNMYFRMGLGQATGTGFPGENIGNLPNYRKWQPIQRANYAFGYGLNVTALQLAQAYSVIANKGTKKPVSLLKLDTDTSNALAQPVVAERYARQVKDMLKTVVGPTGTARKASLDSYDLAGKTGTAHNVGSEGYIDNSYTAIFAGMAPADQPRIVVVSVIREPSVDNYSGGGVAAPLFAKIAEGAMRLLQVPPKPEITASHAVPPVSNVAVAAPKRGPLS